MSLRGIIEHEIAAQGPLPFSRYMELCLYHPELGFYSRSTEKFGKAGDFYTSSDIHAVFGRLLARQFEEIWRAFDSPEQIEILELGAGRGLFARDVLDWSEKKFPAFFQALRYSLQERSARLQARLAETLGRFVESGKACLVEEGGTQAPGVPTIIFANEFFDALPVEIVSTQGTLQVSTQGGYFVEIWAPSSPEEVEFLDRYSVHPEPGERLEVPLPAQQHMTRLAASLHSGVLLAIDYGYTRVEQLAGRHRGTLMAYRQHSASANPYEAPGEQDLTAHVNLTALAAAAESRGMTVHPLLTQSQFLIGIGEKSQFADAFEDCRLPQEHAKVALQLKHLVTPAGLGETFHVLLASKASEEGRVTELSGLSFARDSLRT